MSHSLFSTDEYQRYARHTVLPGFGIEGQERLRQGSVLVIGAGGLGAPMLQYLCAAGVGRIGIIDPDRVSLSNLQRQILFDTRDIGAFKVEVAQRKLQALNPHVQIDIYPQALTSDQALELLSTYDIIADGSDNFPTRYLVNDACVLLGKPLVYGAVFRFEGQVAVFNYLNQDGKRGPNYRNLYPNPPQAGSIPSCAEGGVLGVLPGIIGSMQANEVLKILGGHGEPLSGKLAVFDALSGRTHLMTIPDQAPFPVSALGSYDITCGIPQQPILEVDAQTLRQWIDQKRPFHLIDVREYWEYEVGNMGGTCIPLPRLAAQAEQLPRDLPIVFICQAGIRSLYAVQFVQSQLDIQEAYSLRGGLNAW